MIDLKDYVIDCKWNEFILTQFTIYFKNIDYYIVYEGDFVRNIDEYVLSKIAYDFLIESARYYYDNNLSFDISDNLFEHGYFKILTVNGELKAFSIIFRDILNWSVGVNIILDCNLKI